MRKPSILSASIAAFALALSACDGSTTGAGNDTGNTSTGDWDTTYSVAYRKLNDTLIVIPNTGTTKPFIFSYCSEDYSVTPAVSKVIFDTTEQNVDDDSLTLHVGANLLLMYSHTGMLSSGAKYLARGMFDRVENGNGLIGIWNFTEQDSILQLSGPINDTGIQRMREEEIKWVSVKKATGGLEQIEFTDNLMIIRLKYEIPAKYDVYEWERYSTGYYNITAKATSNNTLTYTGNKTGEIVTVTIAANGNRTYSSTNPKRAPYTTVWLPTTVSQCPADPWFYTFQSENSKDYVLGRVMGFGVAPKSAFTRKHLRF